LRKEVCKYAQVLVVFVRRKLRVRQDQILRQLGSESLHDVRVETLGDLTATQFDILDFLVDFAFRSVVLEDSALVKSVRLT
jgi:hypothetical protein